MATRRQQLLKLLSDTEQAIAEARATAAESSNELLGRKLRPKNRRFDASGW